MILLSLGDEPIVGPVMVDSTRSYSLRVDARVLDWPDWAQHLNVRFLSRWQGNAADVLPVTLERPDTSGPVIRATNEGGVIVKASPATPETPMIFEPEAELVGAERSELIPLIGYRELALHAYDPRHHQITGTEAIDRHVYRTLIEAWDVEAPEQERKEFCALFRVLANEAQKLVANGTFRRGQKVLESEFQQSLLHGAQSAMGANNVHTGTEVSGGRMDIVHKSGLTAELKVERKTRITLETAHRYLGQPTQYATGSGRQMSILCILDLTDSDSPTGILANDVGLLRPALRGLPDPRYPSVVGVIIIRGATRLPSDFAGRAISLA